MTKCDKCGAYNSVVRDSDEDRYKTWPDGTRYLVKSFRCLACASVEGIKRDWMKQHEKDEPVTGQDMAADGRMFTVAADDEEV